MFKRKVKWTAVFSIILFVVMATSVMAETHYVNPGPGTIVTKVDEEIVEDGDVIVLRPGVYTGHWDGSCGYGYHWHCPIEPNNKELTFRSMIPTDPGYDPGIDYVAETIIYGISFDCLADPDCRQSCGTEPGEWIVALPASGYFNGGKHCTVEGLTFVCGFGVDEEEDVSEYAFDALPPCGFTLGVILVHEVDLTVRRCSFIGGKFAFEGDPPQGDFIQKEFDTSGIYCEDGGVVIEDCDISIDRLGFGYPAVMSKGSSDIIIRGSDIHDNYGHSVLTEIDSGYKATGVKVIEEGNLRVENSTISGNESTGIYTQGNGDVIITDNCIIDGENISQGLYLNNSGEITIDGLTEIRNCSASNCGAGVYISDSDAIVEIDGCELTGNTSTNFGGAIYLRDCVSADISNCTISGNEAEYGGGIYIYSSVEDFTMDHCTIADNNAIGNGYESRGGGIYRAGGIAGYEGNTGTITHCKITGNKALFPEHNQYGCGGGIFFDGKGSLDIINCEITGNEAEGVGGGIWFYSFGDFVSQVVNCTIADNNAFGIEGYGGGGYFYFSSWGAGKINLTNCIFWGNEDDSGEGDSYDGYDQIYPVHSNKLKISHCVIQDSRTEGDSVLDNESGKVLGKNLGGNRYDNPSFFDSDNGNYHITSDSSCIDRGDNDAVDWPFDIDDESRIINGVVDIGADEFTGGSAGGLVYNIDKESWHDTIGEAIVNATGGDELVAYPHRYEESVDFGGKVLTLRSVAPENPEVVEATIIDADGDLYAVEAMNGSVLNGFTVTGALDNCIHLDCSCGTIKNCVIEGNGGSGIYQRECGSPVSGPCLVVEDCIIRSNEQGVYAYNSSARIEGCEIYGHAEEGIATGPSETITISDNIIYGNDRGIYAHGDDLDVTIEGNEIYSNTSQGILKGDGSNAAVSIQLNRVHGNNDGVYADYGDGTVSINNNLIYGNSNSGIQSYCSGSISNNTVVNNDTYGIVAQEQLGGPPTNIYNCIVWGNNDDLDLSGTIGLTYNCVEDGDDCGSNGNICSEPQFIDSDFHIDAGSPCVNAGDPSGDYDGQLDIDGQPRLWDGRADIGADESISGGLVHNINQESWHETIQEAIVNANNGEELVVFPGIYYENIDFGKTITLRSTDPYNWDTVGSTIIDGSGTYYTVEFNGEESSSVLKGLTIRNGNYSGIWCYFSYPTISNCIVEGNTSCGIDSTSAPHPLPGLIVEDCIIRNNEFGIMADSACTFEGNQIYDNTTGIYSVHIDGTIKGNHIYGNGKGIYVRYNTTAPIEGNWIYDNSDGIHAEENSTSTMSGNWIYDNTSCGIRTSSGSTTTIRNNMIYGNYFGMLIYADSDADSGNNTIVNNAVGIFALNNATADIYNCILWDNFYGDLFGCSATHSCVEDDGDDNPLFLPGENNYHLSPESPCIDSGDPDGYYLGQVDIDGEPRLIGAYVDIGADETDYPAEPVEPTGEIIWPTISPDAHWWQLDETSGTIAYDSVGDSNGTFNGNDPCWADGLIGGAVDFNGVNDYFSVSSLDSEYSNSSVFTVAGWFKTDQSAGIQTLVGQWSQMLEAGQEYFGWQVLVENNKVIARFGCGTTSDITGTITVTDDWWHHFAMVRNGTSTALYVDGQPEDSGTANFYPLNTKFRIGDGSYVITGSPTLKGGPFDGMIDEVMIFDSALSAGDVNDLYESGAPD